jgi:hypothetical protein
MLDESVGGTAIAFRVGMPIADEVLSRTQFGVHFIGMAERVGCSLAQE